MICTLDIPAQTLEDSISITWTKYIILNENNEVLLRYDARYKAWELTGCGYEGPISFKNLMDSVAVYLGIRYDSFRLGGLFSYVKPGRYRTTIKPYFVVRCTGYTNGKYFADTVHTRWMSIEEAKKAIPYPTMVQILEQLTRFPTTVWGASFEEYTKGGTDEILWRVVEQFYPLN